MQNKHSFRNRLRLFVICLMSMAALPAMGQSIQLTITGTTIDSAKVYDRTTSVNEIQIGSVAGILPAHDVHVMATARYLDYNVGANKPVVVTYAIIGNDRSLYLAPVDDTLYADITPKVLYANGTIIANTKVYDGSTFCEVIENGTFDAPLLGDTLGKYTTAAYRSADAARIAVVTVSHITTGPQHLNYTIVDTNIYLSTISPRPVNAIGARVQLVKEYDGTDTAIVTNPATPTNLVAGDLVDMITTATYSSREVGHNLSITLHYTLTGEQALNYSNPADQLYSTAGAIVDPVALDYDNEYGAPIYPIAEGFCQNTSAELGYSLITGEPTHYRLTFAEDNDFLFNNTDWVPCPAGNTMVTFTVPSNCPAGQYRVYVTFLNEAMVETDPIPVTFTVNIPNTYIVQVFDDVVSIDNTELDAEGNGRFKTFQWYHNGNAIHGATLPYYQDPNGLSGNYSVRVNLDMSDEALVCPISRFTHVNTQKSVNVCPNPVINATRVVLKDFDDESHTLQLFNSYGVMVYSTTFTGAEYQLEMSAFPQGTYLINVDGVIAKTVKL